MVHRGAIGARHTGGLRTVGHIDRSACRVEQMIDANQLLLPNLLDRLNQLPELSEIFLTSSLLESLHASLD